MKIYLDMCGLQRPLDTKTQLRIAVEAEAILSILTLCESGQADLVASEALVFEAGRNPHPVRKRYAAEVLSKANIFVHTDSRVAERARELHEAGFHPLDALHLVSAMEAQADYFCACDDRLLRRATGVDTSPTKVVSPLELITEITR
jgi:predicted nucleic acid-binding protein